MKIIKNIFNNNYSFQLIIIILFLNNIYYSFSTFSIGRYPLVKRLNSGDYIIISSINIIFADDSLTEAKKTHTFGSDIYGTNLNNIGSTTFAQFKPLDNGYILAIAYKTLYIF